MLATVDGQFIKLNVQLCLQHNAREAARRVGLSAIADICRKRAIACLLASVITNRTVLTNGHTGHVPRAPEIFFFLRGPQLAVVN